MDKTRRSIAGGLSTAIILIGLALAFTFGGFNLPIFFVALALSSLVGSLATASPRGIYGGLQSFLWLIGLAFCFTVGFWPWILVVCAASVLLGSLSKLILAGLLSLNLFGTPIVYTRQQPMYDQPPRAPQPTQAPYDQGYQSQPMETYQEGGKRYTYQPQPEQAYDQPQAHYPQQLPPQQQ